MAPKAGQATPDDIMSAAELKPLLMKSKAEPVNCALGLTADKDAVLLLHKKSKPRQLAGALRAEAGKIKLDLNSSSIRFGIAEVDTDTDATLVVFRVNKEVPGNFEQKFRERTKKAGLSKVQFVVDESLNDEPEDGEAAPAAEVDWAGLTTTLAGHITRLQAAAANPAAKELIKLAGEASAAVKAKADAEAASGLVKRLGEGLAALTGPGQTSAPPASAPPASAAPTPAAAPAGTVTYAKSRLAWIATRKKIEADITKLQSEIVSTYQAEGLGAELASSFTAWVSPVLTTLDERLADALDAATNEADAAKRASLVAQARDLIGQYTSFLNSDPRIAELDGNPFVPLALRSTIGGTLAALSQAVH